MTTLGIIQIIYLAINIIGLIASLCIFSKSEELPIISKLFDFIAGRLGRVALVIASILIISLFLPAIFCTAVFAAFLIFYGSHSD